MDMLNENTQMTTPIQEIPDYVKAVSEISAGEIVLLADGAESFFRYSEKKYQLRAVAEPPLYLSFRFVS